MIKRFSEYLKESENSGEILIVVDVQKEFFETGDFRKLELISKKDVSVKLNVAPSTITRAVYAKSIVTPQDREIPLEALMPHRNNIIKYILPELLFNNPGLSDEMIRKIVAKDYNISVSRRYICKCRNEKKS